jgi:DNA-binding GntR family transcriptional regulator
MAGSKLAPAERLSDRVYARLRGEIGSGVIASGARLIEVDLAARLGVSRTPVREALIRLAREGTLEPGDRGYKLRAEDARTILDRLAARRLLDVAIARAAALAVAAGGDAAPLHRALAKAAEAHAAGSVRAFATAHYALRDAIRMLGGNRMLARCAELVDDSFRLARERIYRDADNRATTLAADQALVAAIAAGGADAAERETLTFIATVEHYYQTAAA